MSSVYLLVPLMVLVPLIPAFILFKTLGSKAEVTGREFYGFNIQLGGAFAGYFVLLVVLLNMFKPFLAPPPARLVYTLEGQIVDESQHGIPLTIANFALLPPPAPMISTDQAGNFSVSFIADPGPGNALQFPLIEVSYQDYLPADLSLDPNPNSPRVQKSLQLKRDDLHQIIYAKPISLTRADPNKGDVHLAVAQPVSGEAPEYANIGHVVQATPPPGYSSSAKLVP